MITNWTNDTELNHLIFALFGAIRFIRIYFLSYGNQV
jgi:hypothetical protein